VKAGWTAASVRGRGLLRRLLGMSGARELATAASLEDALVLLGETPYAREVRPGMALGEAQHAVAAVALWHLRVLAGWSPPLGAGPLHLLAGRLEIANITGHLAALSGLPTPEPYRLGSLATAWPAVAAARTAAEVRAALAVSAWGDPGADRAADIDLSLQFAWARRIYDNAPGAADWAVSWAALLVARSLAAGATIPDPAAAHASHLLGHDWFGATSPTLLATRVPRAAARALAGVEDAASLWRAEARWWARVGADAAALSTRSRPDVVVVVGVAALLGVDAFLVRAALAAAGRPQHVVEVLDAMA
jgi:hypothetical protein